MSRCAMRFALILAWVIAPDSLFAQAGASPAGVGLDELKEVPFSSLSSPYITPLGMAALSIRPTEWKHAETDNFIYHYFHGFVATPVSVEAEFYPE
jgi:hypothetical protein